MKKPEMDEHRRRYPEQYSHPLVGKKMQTADGKIGTVLRVMPTRFGLLAAMDCLDRYEAVAIGSLKEVK